MYVYSKTTGSIAAIRCSRVGDIDLSYPAPGADRRAPRVTILRSMPEEPCPDWNFEQGLTDLESVVKELESGDLPLEKAIQVFERGVTLSDRCRKELEDAETRVEILLKRGDKIEAVPFDPAKTLDAPKE